MVIKTKDIKFVLVEKLILDLSFSFTIQNVASGYTLCHKTLKR